MTRVTLSAAKETSVASAGRGAEQPAAGSGGGSGSFSVKCTVKINGRLVKKKRERGEEGEAGRKGALNGVSLVQRIGLDEGLQ